ncbi:Gfo/Idh/MocA family oxidoreductase [Leifsonia sp. NPDC080035]|uniref:Gfo/Idh/MocA family oxidoreductase n=1 Tax=Leifsonia sp. NPDC080035 TaxID=3143936 RepID=A0AAU7GDM2_9MICO
MIARARAARTLNVAIVGCGVIGLNHALAVLRHPRLAVSALVDPDPEAARALAARIGAEAPGAAAPATFTTLAEALTGAEADLVVICTPSGLHVPLAEAALAAGRHVVIEKPLDVSLPRARRLLELSRRAESDGLLVSVISQHRFDPASRVVADAAHGGAFGRLTSAVASVAWWRTQDYYDSGRWRGTWELDGGGAVMNQGVHTVDLLLWFLGRPVEIDARTALLAHERVEVEDVAVATLRFESGALAVLHATTAAYPGLSVRIQVHGDRGSAIIDDDQLEYFGTVDAPGDRAHELVPAEELRGGDRGPDAFVVGHLRQYEDIECAIREGRTPGVTVEDAVLSLAVVRAVYLSATLGRPVLLREVLDGSLDGVTVATGVRP